MTELPEVIHSIDYFENAMDEALLDATPEEIAEGVSRAGSYIEDVAAEAYLDMDNINNATATAKRAVTELAARLKRAEARIVGLELQAETAAQPVT
jgi:hypothetical protein